LSVDLGWRNNWKFYMLSIALFVFYLWLLFIAVHPKVTEEYKAFYIDKYHLDWKPKHYVAAFEDGIDFSRDGWPTFVKSAYGFSSNETWGRWSDATLLPAAKIVFAQSLTGSVCVELTTIATIKQRGKAVIVRMAGEERKFSPTTTDREIHKIEFLLSEPTASIEVEPTASGTRREWDASSADQRKIGLGFLKLRIAEMRCSRPPGSGLGDW